ncbi:longitudinals lacking protein-like [Anopheles merus]|uniref:BTB domain-containing protein n=1 Tax=Anopheles merus TaxID=30066 RepID=A0A182VDF4_ANOME|nr:longitudinals lacking protein-like [Anopheles merus]
MCDNNVIIVWNGFTEHVSGVFRTFRHETALQDVILYCEGQFINTHKLLLASCSEVFRRIFLERANAYHLIRLIGFRYVDVSLLLDFMYEGEMALSQEQLPSLKQAALRLEIKSLANLVTSPERVSEQADEQDTMPSATATTDNNLEVASAGYVSPLELMAAVATLQQEDTALLNNDLLVS